MTPLYVVVEGQTEEAFVSGLLAPHLADHGVFATPIIVTTRRGADGRKHRGGGDWDLWRREIRTLCRDSRPALRLTTLFDLYGLPSNFPRLAQRASIADTRVRCELLEGDMFADIGDWRFIPYLQRHEFEALVLAGLPALRDLLDDRDDLAGLKALEKDIRGLSPEDVDGGLHTAPSKRLKRFIPSYAPEEPGAGGGKSYLGPLVTAATGLGVLRERCPRFGAWLARLEALEDDNPWP